MEFPHELIDYLKSHEFIPCFGEINYERTYNDRLNMPSYRAYQCSTGCGICFTEQHNKTGNFIGYQQFHQRELKNVHPFEFRKALNKIKKNIKKDEALTSLLEYHEQMESILDDIEYDILNTICPGLVAANNIQKNNLGQNYKILVKSIFLYYLFYPNFPYKIDSFY